MNDTDRARYETRANIIKALAHPSRLYIVEKLADKPYCVRELTEMIGADASTVSKHLSVLKNVGIVSDRKRGTSVYYNLEASCVLKFVDCVEAVIQGNISKQALSLGPRRSNVQEPVS
jgi:ArsR family transcriptional regulator